VTGELYCLVYFSFATEADDPDQMKRSIDAILASARRNNARSGVTGALLCRDGCFAQILEGALPDVEQAFERIQYDSRHRDVTIAHFHPIEERSFAAWSMAATGADAPMQHLALASLARGAASGDGRRVVDALTRLAGPLPAGVAAG